MNRPTVNNFRAAIAAIVLALFTNIVGAEASGPDFYRMVDVAADDTLNMRTGPSADYSKIGEIPADADRVVNFSCTGGL